MTLTITTISWGIDRRTGERSENVVGKDSFEAKVGPVGPVGAGPRKATFQILSVEEDGILIHLSDKLKDLPLKVGQTYTHRPFSMDAGFIYHFELN
ncbi:MAG: hypothetical protein K6E59_05895 [Bacilli bacterium]|nr:hypothetical protein [Bacilli bacterium]